MTYNVFGGTLNLAQPSIRHTSRLGIIITDRISEEGNAIASDRLSVCLSVYRHDTDSLAYAAFAPYMGTVSLHCVVKL